jgi:hypothetical protein
VSAALNVATATGTITNASAANPIVITSATHGLTTGQKIVVSDVLGQGGANGTWVVTVLTTNTFSLNGSVSSGRYAGGGQWYRGAGQLNYTNIEVSTDPRVVKRQILRNRDGDVATYYVDIEDSNSGTTATSTNTEAQLGAIVPLVDIEGKDVSLERHGVPPGYKRFLATMKGRLWFFGQPTESRGAVVLTNGSPTVTGIATKFTAGMVGWELFADSSGASRSYKISAVNVSTQVLTLTTNYAGTTQPYASYAVTPPIYNSTGGGEDLTTYYSEAALPESVNYGNSITLTKEPNSGSPTGMFVMQNLVYFCFERQLTRLAFSVRPSDDAQLSVVCRRGVINNRCYAEANGVMYLMDRNGVYQFGGGQPQEMAEVLGPLFDGDGGFARINWRRSETFHCSHYQSANIIRWYVCLDGSRYPRHALCYHYLQQSWWIEKYPYEIASSSAGLMDSESTVFLGGRDNVVLTMTDDRGDFIPKVGTLRGLATNSGALSLVASDAAFSSALAGAYVTIVSGKGQGQSRRVALVASDTLIFVDKPWNILPDTTSEYQFGCIAWRWKSGWRRWANSSVQIPRALEVAFKPTSGKSGLFVKRYRNMVAMPERMAVKFDGPGFKAIDKADQVEVDTTVADGLVRVPIADRSGHSMRGHDKIQVELSGLTGGEAQEVYQLVIEGAG